MAESIVSDVVSKLLEWFVKSAIDEIAPYFGGERRLKELEQTMVMIQARLVDAERRGEGHDGEAMVKAWLKRLKRVLYRLEDLFEEVAIADTEKEQVQGGKLTKPIRLLFSCSNPLKMNKEVAKEAKAIMEELNSITSLMNSLNFREGECCRVVNVDSNRETHSLIRGEEVIGRDEDKNKIVAMLLKSDDCRENLSVIPIVGIGGQGKTTLAQLVFNDECVQKHFELKFWACISDVFSLYELAGKVLMSISGGDYRQLTLDQIQSRLREDIDGQRYLLVLDDIWDEDRKRWLELRRFLCGGKQGSKILVTSRSKIVAQNMATVEPYALGGLLEEESWDLFRSLAFKPGQEEGNPNFASIGKGIVAMCANVPLAIKAIACLLYSMDTVAEWEAFKDKDLTMIEQDHENRILSTLKLSYDRLAPQLKQCFAYCSLFPKDHVFVKQDLTYLWMAQGFLGSSRGHQSLEDVGHGFFMQLTRRCFFQNIKVDEDGEIFKCKMHDLVHDLALLTAGGETLLVDRPTKPVNDNIWHVNICSSLEKTPSWLLATNQMRSFVQLDDDITWLNCGKVLSSLKGLRVLDLGRSNYFSLPDSLGELKHLRYLRIGPSDDCRLQECITRLLNLQTLDLTEWRYFEELPRGFSKLINLRHLQFHCPTYLIDMPDGFGKLTSLRTLDEFVVGERNGLDALATLKHLAGRLTICFAKLLGNALSETMVGILKDMKLSELELRWHEKLAGVNEEEEDELALRCLQPPPSLKRLTVEHWKGVRIPSWGMDEFPCLLPNLVTVKLYNCMTCQHLPSLSRLPNLRTLFLWRLCALEYIENGGNKSEASFAEAAKYYPSLERLTLRDLPELRGWSRAEEEDTVTTTIIHPQTKNVENKLSLLVRPYFPRLSCLKILDCQKLRSMPLVPRLGLLLAKRTHGKLIKHLLQAEAGPELGSLTTYLSTLRFMKIEFVPELESVSIRNLCSLESLEIMKCPDLINLTAGSPKSSLRELDIHGCGKLRDISGALQHLALLKKLTIRDCNELQSLRSLGCLTTLETLYLSRLPNLTALPESIGNLTQLRELTIHRYVELTELPESICNLASLQTFEILKCPELRRRYKPPGGQDWPLIQYLPVTWEDSDSE